MLASSSPPLPPPGRTNARPGIEPDEQWKDDLRKRIEQSLRGMVGDAQTVHDTILNSQPSESSRELGLLDYEKRKRDIRMLAQEFHRQLRLKMSECGWAHNVVDSNPPEEANKKEEEAHRLEENARQSLEGAVRLGAGASAKMR
jgi:hypothetical protein